MAVSPIDTGTAEQMTNRQQFLPPISQMFTVDQSKHPIDALTAEYFAFCKAFLTATNPNTEK